MSASHGNDGGGNEWDDDVIMNDWKGLLEEYKKYHSMAARGEKVRKVADSVKKGTYNGPYADMLKEGHKNATANNDASNSAADNEASVKDGVTDAGEDHEMSIDKVTTVIDQTPPQPDQITYPPNPSDDPAIVNLAQAWYWAGYYAGQLSERNRIAKAQSTEDPKK